MDNNLFLNNKYSKWYFSIINNIKNKNRKKLKRDNKDYIYYESHHIIPKSIDESLKKDKNNIILLTPREHFICHKLLVKMFLTNTDNYYKMLNSVTKFSQNNKYQNRYFRGIDYSYIREAAIKNRLGKKHSIETRNKISESNKGKIISEEQRKKCSEIFKKMWKDGKGNTSYKRSEETRLKMSKTRKGKSPWNKGKTYTRKMPSWNKGKKHKPESIEKMRQKQAGKNNGFFGKKHTQETKEKMKKSKIKNIL